MSKKIVILPSKSILYLLQYHFTTHTTSYFLFFTSQPILFIYLFFLFSLPLFFFSSSACLSLLPTTGLFLSSVSLSLCYPATKPIPKSILDPKSTQQNSNKPIPKSPKTNQKIITNPKPYQTKTTKPNTASNHLQPKLSHH